MLYYEHNQWGFLVAGNLHTVHNNKVYFKNNLQEQEKSLPQFSTIKMQVTVTADPNFIQPKLIHRQMHTGHTYI